MGVQSGHIWLLFDIDINFILQMKFIHSFPYLRERGPRCWFIFNRDLWQDALVLMMRSRCCCCLLHLICVNQGSRMMLCVLRRRHCDCWSWTNWFIIHAKVLHSGAINDWQGMWRIIPLLNLSLLLLNFSRGYLRNGFEWQKLLGFVVGSLTIVDNCSARDCGWWLGRSSRLESHWHGWYRTVAAAADCWLYLWLSILAPDGAIEPQTGERRQLRNLNSSFRGERSYSTAERTEFEVSTVRWAKKTAAKWLKIEKWNACQSRRQQKTEKSTRRKIRIKYVSMRKGDWLFITCTEPSAPVTTSIMRGRSITVASPSPSSTIPTIQAWWPSIRRSSAQNFAA